MLREIAKRYLYDPIDADLAQKMVFLSGPRQVGKTTLALRLVGASDPRHPAYLSWDDVRTRPRIQRGELPPDEPRVILDELHKYARWRYFKERTAIPRWYQVHPGSKDVLVDGVRILPFPGLCHELAIP
ncbi:MAG: AAA family ATPase [Deltaproteobacteria bacterium]|nr:AAA family ATPase [Deltaproteobacteria bacterium]